MLKDKIAEALNDHLNAEIYSAYLYYSMSAYFLSLNLKGFANWMYVQALEEMVHADKFFHFISDRGGRVLLKAVACPETKWASTEEVLSETLKHERIVTARIHGLVDMAMQEKDFATKTFLDWFVNEQVEEEASADEILQSVKMVQASPQALFMLDREVGQRTFTPPAAGAKT